MTEAAIQLLYLFISLRKHQCVPGLLQLFQCNWFNWDLINLKFILKTVYQGQFLRIVLSASANSLKVTIGAGWNAFISPCVHIFCH